MTIIGRIGQDPEMRYMPDGTAVTNFSVATTNSTGHDRACPKGWKESYNGKRWEVTTWFRVAAWGKLAETVNQHCKKGMLVFVEGELAGEASDGNLNPRVWAGKDGAARANFELTARNVKFLDYGGDKEPEKDDKDDYGF